MSMTKPTSEQVTFLQAGANVGPRTVLAKLRDSVSVKDWGAVGDGVADDRAAIQAAIDECFAVPGAGPDSLHFPAGTYKVNSPLIWNKPIRLTGSSRYGSTIVAGASMNAVIQGSVLNSETNQRSRSSFVGINIDGNARAQFGIQGTTNHTNFSDLRVIGTLQSAMDIRFGWCNAFSYLELSYNLGDGLRLIDNANQNIVLHCKIFSNAGIGLYAIGSAGILVSNSLFETCAKAGIFLERSIRGMTIDTCYFEYNGTTGVTFTSPATITVRADIVANGGSATTISQANVCQGVSITNNYTRLDTIDCFVFANGLIRSRITNNVGSGSVVPAVKYYGRSDTGNFFSFGYPQDTVIGHNGGMIDGVTIDPAGAGAYVVSSLTPRVQIETAKTSNLAVTDFNKWTAVFGSGGSFVRSSSEFDANPLTPVWEIQASAGPLSTAYYGFTLDASKFAQYHNQWMLFGVWIKAPFVFGVNDGSAVLLTNSTITSSSFWTGGTNWVPVTTAFKMPTTGTIQFGVRAGTAAGTGASNVLVAAPVMCLLGADFQLLQGAIGDMTTFSGTAAPVAGTWKRGDVVMNSTPSAGGTPGWVCVTAGTPGTWKAMSNVAA